MKHHCNILVYKVDENAERLGLDGKEEPMWVPMSIDLRILGMIREGVTDNGTCLYTVAGEYFGTIDTPYKQLKELWSKA